MKLHAARDDRDLDDAAQLYSRAGLTTAQDGRELLARTYPASQRLPRHRYVIEDVAARAEALRVDGRERTRGAIGDRIDSAVRSAKAAGGQEKTTPSLFKAPDQDEDRGARR